MLFLTGENRDYTTAMSKKLPLGPYHCRLVDMSGLEKLTRTVFFFFFSEVKLQVEGHNHASHKSFATLNTAEQAYRDKKWPGRKDHQSTDSESYDGSDNGDKDDLVTMMRRTKLED